MPCRDYMNDEDLRSLRRDSADRPYKARNDKLAAELCKLRAFILKHLDTNTLKTEDEKQMLLKIYNDQVKHREEDRKEAIKVAKAEVRKISDVITKIQKLGGLPTPEMVQKLAELETKVMNVENVHVNDLLSDYSLVN